MESMSKLMKNLQASGQQLSKNEKIPRLSSERCKNIVAGAECKRNLLIENGREFCFYCEEIVKQDQQLAAQTIARLGELKHERVQDFFKINSLINPKLLKAEFDNYIPQSQSQEVALIDCKRYAHNFAFNLAKENDIGLLLYGGYGLGKSHLAVSILKTVMQQKLPGTDDNMRAIYINLPKLKTKIKDSWNKGSDISEAQIIAQLENCELLVFDELGGEYNKKDEQGNSFFNDIIYQILDARQGRNTVFTSNMQPEQLERHYSQKIFERIFSNIHLLELNGKSYRMKGEQ